MKTRRTAALLTPGAVALAVGLTLSACSSSTDATPTTASTSTAAAAVSTKQTPAPPAVGASVTSDEDVAAAEAAGLGVFDVFDEGGTWANAIVFDKSAPLPDSVKAAIAAPVIAAFDAAMATGITGDTATGAQVAAVTANEQKGISRAKSASSESGRSIVIVYRSYGSLDGTNYGTYWLASSADGMIRASAAATSDGSVAAAQAWVATQPDPTAYEIVVAG